MFKKSFFVLFGMAISVNASAQGGNAVERKDELPPFLYDMTPISLNIRGSSNLSKAEFRTYLNEKCKSLVQDHVRFEFPGNISLVDYHAESKRLVCAHEGEDGLMTQFHFTFGS